MKLEDQVTSLELSKKLKELEVKQESYFIYYVSRKSARTDMNLTINQQYPLMSWVDFVAQNNYQESDATKYELYPAFTVAELGEMLPKIVDGRYHLCLSFLGGKGTPIPSETLWFCGYRQIISQETENAMYGLYLDVDRRIAHASGVSEADARAKLLIYLIENDLIKVNEIQEHT